MDLYLFNLINQYAGKWVCLDSIAIFFARYFEYVLLLSLLIFLAVGFRKHWKMVIESFVSAVLARVVIVNIIRFIWFKPRPFVDNTVNLLIDYPNKAAFPSGHAAFYFALSTIIFLYNKKIGILFYIASSLIVVSRVFIGIHWLADILAGIIVGVLSALLIKKVSEKISKKI